MRGVFISYRQDDAKPWALLLRQDLVEAFGEQWIFLDKDTLHAGNWREQIQQALDRSGVELVVIGKRWLTSADDRGQRRLDSPDDVHRREIAGALSRKDMTVIPVIVDGASLPSADDLPADIRMLTDQQAREMSDNNARRKLDFDLLIVDIERATGLVARRSAPSFWTRQKIVVAVLVILGALSVSLLAMFNRHVWWPEQPSSQPLNGAKLDAKVENNLLQLLAAIKSGSVRIESGGRFVGSGFFITPEGVVLTTAYLADRLNREDIRVKLSSGSRVRARLTRVDTAEDVALMDTEVTGKVTALVLSTDTISQDDGVIAVVQSLDEEWLGVTGKVSRVGVDTAMGKGRIEVDIPESLGRLGSPVMNTRGEVIGVMQGSYKDRPGFSFLIPASTIKSMLDK